MELGRAETLRHGDDGVLIACGTLVASCLRAAEQLAGEGLELSVINARFVKPLDAETIVRAVRGHPFAVTVEEGALMGGFGSAVLEAACDAGVNTALLRRLGIPDRFIEHGGRDELLRDLGLDVTGIAETCRQLATDAGVGRGQPARAVRT